MMNSYGRQSNFPSFLLDNQRAAIAAAAANSFNHPLAQLGLSQFGPNFNNALGQFNANEVYNLLSGCFPFYPNHPNLMNRPSSVTSQANSSPSAAISSSNPALTLAQYQQLQQQQPQQNHQQ